MVVNSGLHVQPGLSLGKTFPGTYCKGDWVGPKAGMDAAEKKSLAQKYGGRLLWLPLSVAFRQISVLHFNA
jgi:hypothetical protein